MNMNPWRTKRPFGKWAFRGVLALAAACSCRAETALATPPDNPPQTMKIQLKIGDKILSATLHDSPATRDFIAQLPLTLDLRDYNRTEKIADLPKKLTTAGTPPGSDPSVGDIAYYAPWGNLAIFYKDFGYSKGLVILGKLDSGIETLSKAGDGKLTIELAPRRGPVAAGQAEGGWGNGRARDP